MEPDYKRTLINPLGRTRDILQEVLDCYQASKTQPVQLAQQLKGANPYRTGHNIWQFVRQNIRYQLDPVAEQFSKTPARTVADGFGDCKAYSILINSLLYCAGIEHGFRFVGFKKGRPVTHVYTVAIIAGKEVPIDACLAEFDKEAAFQTKIDKMQKQDYYYDNNPMIGFTKLGKAIRIVGNATKGAVGIAANIVTGKASQIPNTVKSTFQAVTAVKSNRPADYYTNPEKYLTAQQPQTPTNSQPSNGQPIYSQQPTQSGNNNMLLYGAIAVGALVLLKGKKKKKQ